MNFFGHAVVAVAHERSARFVLGAMLPDFATMLRVRVPDANDTELAAGVALHHATDDAFHGAHAFHRIAADSFAALQQNGIDRGAARAIAHIGVEILLDRALALADDGTAARAYEAAIADEPGFALAAWASADDADRALALHRALVRHGAAAHRQDDAAIAERLRRILAPRPRLAFPEAQLGIVIAWANATSPAITAIAPALLAEVTAATRR